jgi:Family of unknown function (DUF6489)
MKFNIDVDCTPEEVRRLIGLPDLAPLHDVYLDKMKDMMTTGVTPDMVEQMVRTWMPMGGQGMDFVKELMGSLGGSGKGKKD